jgi:hypothetical protein
MPPSSTTDTPARSRGASPAAKVRTGVNGALARARRPRADGWTLALAGLLAVALAVRLWGVKSGLPYAFNVDENAHFVPRAIGFFGHTLNPYYFVNPPATSYVFYLVFSLWFGTGQAAAHAYATDATEVWLLARVTVAVISTSAVWLTYLAGKRLFDRPTALLGAGILTFAFLPVFYSHLALNDAPAMSAVALSLFGTALVLRSGRWWSYAIAGAGLGLAISTKYTAGIVIVPLVSAALARWWEEPDRPRRVRDLVRPSGLLSLLRSPALRGLVLIAGAATVLAFAITNPYAIRSWSEFIDGIRKQGSATSGSDKLGVTESSGFRYYLWSLTWGMGWVPALASVGGAVLLVRRDRRLAWVLLPAVVIFFLFMGNQQRFFGRWFLPAYPILCLLAAYGAVELVRWAGRRAPRRRPLLAAIAAAALVGQGLVYSVHNDLVGAREDTRTQARTWLLDHVPPGSRVVMEPVVTDSWLMDTRVASPDSPDGSIWKLWSADDFQDSAGLIAADAVNSRLDTGAAGRELVTRGMLGLFPGQQPPGTLPGRRRTSAGVVGAEGYTRSLRPELIDAYERLGYCYVVTGSTQSQRAVSQPGRVPEAVAYYRELARRGTEVYRATPFGTRGDSVPFNFDWSFDYYPLAYHRPGPVMTVYRLNGGACAPGAPAVAGVPDAHGA